MNDVYQLIIVAGVKEDNNEIVRILQKIAASEVVNDLRLLNYFQEVPVSYPATVENVEDGMVELSVHQHQAVVMKDQRTVFLKSRHFPHDAVARVFRSDVNRCVAILTSFAYAHIRAERRQFVRVKLHGKVPVTFFSISGELKGEIVDISIGGIGVWGEPAQKLNGQSKGVLSVSLENPPLQIPAMLLKKFDEEGMAKYAFEIQADIKTETKISQFIFQRQVEIIRELKDGI